MCYIHTQKKHYFSPIVACDDGYLSKRWKELYDLRCLVAHNNILNKNEFKRIETLADEIKPKILKAINSLDKVTVPEQEKETVTENVVSNVNELYGEYIHRWKELEFECLRINAANSINLHKNSSFALGGTIEWLSNNKLVDDEFEKQIKQVRNIRNLIVHTQPNRTDADLSDADVRDNLSILNNAIGRLKSL